MRSKLGTAVVVVCAALIGACSQPQPPATAEPTQPLDTRPTEPPVADPSEPVASATPRWRQTLPPSPGSVRSSTRPATPPMIWPPPRWKPSGARSASCWRSATPPVSCRALDDVVEGNGDLRRFRDAHYVWVKVNASDEQPNTAFFAQFPVMERDYPHLLVLDADGGLLVSQATGELRRGEAFQPARVSAFLKQWAPDKPE